MEPVLFVRRGPVLSLLPLVLALPGCFVIERQSIEAEDQAAIIPGARVHFIAWKRGDRDPVGEDQDSNLPDPDDPRQERELPVVGSVGAEGAFSYASDDTHFDLHDGAPGQLDEVLLPPGRYDLEYEIFDSSATFRGGFWLYRVFGLEALAGLSFRQVNLEASGEGVRDSDETFGLGPLGGVQLSLRPLAAVPHGEAFTLYGRGTYDHAFVELGKDNELGTGELGFEIGPFWHLGFYGGWRWWHFRRDEDDNSGYSKVKLDLQGPVVGLMVVF